MFNLLLQYSIQYVDLIKSIYVTSIAKYFAFALQRKWFVFYPLGYSVIYDFIFFNPFIPFFNHDICLVDYV